jgi:hypothetical protein
MSPFMATTLPGRGLSRHTRLPKGHELLDLASEGNDESVQDLWLEYQYDFSKQGRGNE